MAAAYWIFTLLITAIIVLLLGITDLATMLGIFYACSILVGEFAQWRARDARRRQ